MLEIKTQIDLQNFITRKVKCDVSGLSGYQRLFLIEIADRVNHKHSYEKQWRCWPSVEGIGKCIGLGKTKTNEIIGSLCKLGVLEYKKGNSRIGNEYKINVTALGKLVDIEVKYFGEPSKQIEQPNIPDGDDESLLACYGNRAEVDEEYLHELQYKPIRSPAILKQQDPCDLIDDPF